MEWVVSVFLGKKSLHSFLTSQLLTPNLFIYLFILLFYFNYWTIISVLNLYSIIKLISEILLDIKFKFVNNGRDNRARAER